MGPQFELDFLRQKETKFRKKMSLNFLQTVLLVAGRICSDSKSDPTVVGRVFSLWGQGLCTLLSSDVQNMVPFIESSFDRGFILEHDTPESRYRNTLTVLTSIFVFFSFSFLVPTVFY